MDHRRRSTVVAVAALLLVAAIFAAGMVAAHRQTWIYQQAIELRRTLWPAPPGARSTGNTFHYARRTSQFSRAAAGAGLVMIGDSLTAEAEWAELLPEVKVHNRGVFSDTAAGVEARLDQICEHRYPTAFLMIGINDVLDGTDGSQFEQTYNRVLGRLKDCTDAVIAAQLIVPAKTDALKAKTKEFNARIRRVAKSLAVETVDLNPLLAPDGALSPRFSNDGIHLTGEGYALWSSLLTPLIAKP